MAAEPIWEFWLLDLRHLEVTLGEENTGSKKRQIHHKKHYNPQRYKDMIWQLTQTDVLHSSPFSIAHTAGAHSNDTESKKTQQLLPALWLSTTQRQRPVTRGRASSPISAGSRNRQHRKSLWETQRKLYQVQPVLQNKLNSFSTNFIMTAFFLDCLYLEVSLTYKHVGHQGHSFLLKKGIKNNSHFLPQRCRTTLTAAPSEGW